MRTRYADIPAYTTKDGSEIRELWHPDVHGAGRQSLAEATLPPRSFTLAHRHLESEEIYHFTSGFGTMSLDGETFDVTPGDTVRIKPGTTHQVYNHSAEPMRILCLCTPPYRHEDTELI